MTAVVLSGGGAKGAFQAGSLWAMRESLMLNDLKLIVGTSVGALNAGALAYNNYEMLLEFWKSIKSRSCVLNHAWWKFWSLKGIYSTNPLEKIINKVIDPDLLNDAWLEAVTCSCNIETGEVKYVSNKSASLYEFKKSMLTSSLIPMFMEPVDGLWFDGGMRENTPMQYAIDRGFKNIIVITTNPISKNLQTKFKSKWPHMLDYIKRTCDDVMQHEIFMEDLENLDQGCRVLVISPEESLESTLGLTTLEFDPIKIKKGIEIGMKRTFDIINNLQ